MNLTRKILRPFAAFVSAVWCALAPSGSAAEPRITAPGFAVTLAAGAPLVRFPMMACFDERGRLFVAENAGENLDGVALEARRPNRILRLVDDNGDGVFDRATVFAEGLTFPQGVACLDGAVFVAAPPFIWRFEDTDDDGRADKRRELVGQFALSGIANDLHGPFAHPGGRLFWTSGRTGHDVMQRDGSTVSKGFAARVWSCKPDGSDIRVHAGGGMDNPVALAFDQQGEVFGTVNLFHYSPRSDAIVHWVHGGVYPRADQGSLLAEFPRTGELLGPIATLGHVAPAGLALPRSDAWRHDGRSTLIFAEFNPRRLMRLGLEPAGSTFRGQPEPFATGEPGMHFTDVVEDADGSLIALDTGDWFRNGCPTSGTDRRSAHGGIYRLRPAGAISARDPRGLQLDWAASPGELARRLDDARPAVRSRAVAECAQRGDAAVAALTAVLRGDSALARSNAVWSLLRIATPAAADALRPALADAEPAVRQVACHAVFFLRDQRSAPALVRLLADHSLSVRREAARALGVTGDASAVSALVAAAGRAAGDPFLEHACTFALIELDRPGTLAELIATGDAGARRAALVALDRLAPSALAAAPVLAQLGDENTRLRAVIRSLVQARPAWAADVAAHFARRPPVAEEADLIGAFLGTDEVRIWFRQRIDELPAEVALAAVAQAAPSAWDDAWRKAIEAGLKRGAPAAMRAATAHRAHDFSSALRESARDPSRPVGWRVAALRLAAAPDSPLSEEAFTLLHDTLKSSGAPDTRAQAAEALGGARLTPAHLAVLAELLPQAGPTELPVLLAAFRRESGNAALGRALLRSLQVAPARWSVPGVDFQRLFRRYPAEVAVEAEPLIAEIMEATVAQTTRVAELERLAARGNVAKGEAAFRAGAGACVACHRASGEGGVIGPDLSAIGRIRNGRDLAEAIAFPSASFARGYESFTLTRRDGATLVGTIPRESAEAVTVRTTDGLETNVPRAEILKIDPAAVSLMPAGLDRALPPETLGDLLAFLLSLK